jgi:hypothetical protein
MKTTIILLFTLLCSTLAFAGIHDACHTDSQESRIFAVAYTGAVIDIKADEMTSDGKKVYAMPALNYKQAFDAVCKVVDAHPELWNRPSRDAVTFAVDTLWKRRN